MGGLGIFLLVILGIALGPILFPIIGICCLFSGQIAEALGCFILAGVCVGAYSLVGCIRDYF